LPGTNTPAYLQREKSFFLRLAKEWVIFGKVAAAPSPYDMTRLSDGLTNPRAAALAWLIGHCSFLDLINSGLYYKRFTIVGMLQFGVEVMTISYDPS
jgi:hypothetical protein